VNDPAKAARAGFSTLPVPAAVADAAFAHLTDWLADPASAPHRPQLDALIAAERWDALLDSFYRVLPFGTGGRRGRVGIGPGRFNPQTLGSSVQGHIAFLRQIFPGRPLSVVIAYDVRRFEDLRGELMGDVDSPLRGMSSWDFACIAAEIYAAEGVSVWLPPGPDHPVSTPELSFAIRHLGADAGLNVSASHNPPDDNGGKFYNAEGGQEVPPRDEQMANLVAAAGPVRRMPLAEARACERVRETPQAVWDAYQVANVACSLDPSARSARVVFTALHGTGRRTVLPVLRRAGFEALLEPTQAEYDSAFSAVPFRVPNPEQPRSMDAAVAHAEANGADLVMACDPDADRLGLMARARLHPQPSDWRFFTGNELAALIAHHALRGRSAGGTPLVIKTEVTSRLITKVAALHDAQTIGHLMVGFKYIGEGLAALEERGEFAGVKATLADFVLGAEESHGVLVTPAVRDKDAAGGALLLAELASAEKDAGRTLVDTLRGLWERVGYVHNELSSVIMRGAVGRARIQDIQAALRAEPPTQIAGRRVTAFYDRQDEAGPLGPLRSGTDRASRDVLVFELEGDARLVLRPSGTEPKSKVYAEVVVPPTDDLGAVVAQARSECQELARGLVTEMLARIDMRPPPWVLAISDLVSIEEKLRFAAETMPALLNRLDSADTEGAETGDVGAWLEGQLAGLGSGGRALVATGVAAFIADESPGSASELAGLFGLAHA